MVRIGVVGCGKIAEKHLNALKKFEGVEVTVTDVVEKGKTVAADYEVGWHNDPDGLVSGAGVDAIDVCIPTPGHAKVITKALESGKHVFCEKPLARTVSEAEQIQERAAAADRILMVGYLYRFHPALQFVRTVIKESIIGDPYYAIFRLGGRGSHKAWKHRRETGGGAANEMLVHMLDLILWFFGDAKSVETLYRDTILEEREIEGTVVHVDAEDVILLRMDMENGTRVLCESDLITPSYMNYLEVHGTNGSAMTSILDYMPTFVYCREPKGTFDRGHNVRQFPAVNLIEEELGHFINCVQNGEQPAVNSLEESVQLMRLLSRILR